MRFIPAGSLVQIQPPAPEMSSAEMRAAFFALQLIQHLDDPFLAYGLYLKVLPAQQFHILQIDAVVFVAAFGNLIDAAGNASEAGGELFQVGKIVVLHLAGKKHFPGKGREIKIYASNAHNKMSISYHIILRL